MVSIIGVDSRSFVRHVTKSDGTKGTFQSVLGMAVKVKDYNSYITHYRNAVKKAIKHLSCDRDLQFYCFRDIKDCKTCVEFMEVFFKEINKYIEKVHVFYTLFSKTRLSEVKVYGRLAKREKIKLNEGTRTYEKLLSEHIIQCFPAICTWRLTEYLDPRTVEFHLDSYTGHIFEAQEQLDTSPFNIFIYPGGDCVNPVISTADLLIAYLDITLKKSNKFLLFENIRPALPEFGEKVIVYPISNKHLKHITPLDKQLIENGFKYRHPVFWLFKGEEIINSDTIKKSISYRNLQDYAASQFGIVKLFEKSKDINFFKEGDYGVYLNTRSREQIQSYLDIGKKFKLFKFDNLSSDNSDK